MMNILMMMAVMLLFIQVRGAESDEAREARLAQDREVKNSKLDSDIVFADPGMGGSV